MNSSDNSISASVRARLLNLSKASGQSFELILTRFAMERLLYRLARSDHSDRFVLKGAMLLNLWFDDPHRSTRDLDLLGFIVPEAQSILDTFREVFAVEVDFDGITFDPRSLRIDRIRENQAYGGYRLRALAFIGRARINLTIDIGFGDALVPVASLLEYPTLLEFPAPMIRAYARESVIAEKFQAIVDLGHANSRMKDFYDLWLLTQSFEFDDMLAHAIAATFARRATEIPGSLPDGLTPDFANDQQKQRQWTAFLQNVTINPGPLTEVIRALSVFLMTHAATARRINTTKTQHDSG